MLSFLMSLFIFIETSIYSISFTTTDGTPVSFSSFQGKKILIVNIATGSPKAGQLIALQQLQQQYADELIVIAFPSNSFGNESRSDSEIKEFCTQTYTTNFLIAAQAPVHGSSAQPVYKWLTRQSDNGVTSDAVRGDFQKYLIDTEGNLVGIFDPSRLPGDSSLARAIQGSH